LYLILVFFCVCNLFIWTIDSGNKKDGESRSNAKSDSFFLHILILTVLIIWGIVWEFIKSILGNLLLNSNQFFIMRYSSYCPIKWNWYGLGVHWDSYFWAKLSNVNVYYDSVSDVQMFYHKKTIKLWLYVTFTSMLANASKPRSIYFSKKTNVSHTSPPVI
jgi:hypothetical protein